jgi:hypothetical protein
MTTSEIAALPGTLPPYQAMLYIAGPMSGYPDFNFPAFHAAEAVLLDQGYLVVNPARIDETDGWPAGAKHPEDGSTTIDDDSRRAFLRRDFLEMLRCDGLVLLDGWSESVGANAELAVARMAGLPVWHLTGPWNDRLYMVEFDRSPEWELVWRAAGDRRPEWIEDSVLSSVETAIRLVDGARQADYGHPFDDFSKTALHWQAILGHPVTPEQVALCMVGVKLSREVNRPKADNIVDAHGYLLTYEMVMERRREMTRG